MSTDVQPGTKCLICKAEATDATGAFQIIEDLPLCPTCIGKCDHCGKPVPATHRLCRLCQTNTKEFIRENEVPLVHTAADLSDQGRHVKISPVTGKPYHRNAGRSRYDEDTWP